MKKGLTGDHTYTTYIPIDLWLLSVFISSSCNHASK